MISLYLNNRCSKSRAAQALLEASGHEFQTIYYLDALPTTDKLLELLSKGEFVITDLVRMGDVEMQALDIAKMDTFTDKQWCELLAKHPQLIERPMVEADKAAVIGRPVDNIQILLDTL